MGLDQSRHNIFIVYQAPQLVVGTQVFYNSLQLSNGTEVKMLWEVVEQMVVEGFITSELYVIVEPTIVEAGEGSQHTVLDRIVDEHIDSIPLQFYQGCTENTGDGYSNEPCQTFPHVNSTEEEEEPQEVHKGEHLSHDELHGGTSENEDDHGLGDDATHIDVTRDDFEEFLDTMDEHEDVDHIENVVVEANRDTCPSPDPTPEWFTKNTWDNMFDPSPIMQVEISSSIPGEQPMKVRENFSFKTEHSDSERLMVSCKDDSYPWSVRAICCKGDNVWKIAKCKGPHTCNKIQNAHDGWMIHLAFLAYVLECYIQEDPAYKIKNLRHFALANLKHELSHYKDAKQKAVVAIYRDFKESYAELPHFLARLKDASLSTKYKLLVDDNYERGTCTFKSVFWAFRPCIVGFKHYRPMISIDATHLYRKYKGKLMIAIATDANNKIYLLAFAVVESESTETWGWFLACIRSMPITAMVKYTWFKLNAYFDDRQNKSIAQLNLGKKWCQYALDIFMRNKVKA
ncbi:hypothetical protein SO802_023113 [Lithocarpus litseifolius]|uniref:MULE transposase domain-containing protein n=1 Tax=Lithocarpus litseifolius TaxID=425828 RepID=A0AAW2C583_9ROSI